VYHDFHWLLVATKLLTAKLYSLYVKELESRVGIRVVNFGEVGHTSRDVRFLTTEYNVKPLVFLSFNNLGKRNIRAFVPRWFEKIRASDFSFSNLFALHQQIVCDWIRNSRVALILWVWRHKAPHPLSGGHVITWESQNWWASAKRRVILFHVRAAQPLRNQPVGFQ